MSIQKSARVRVGESAYEYLATNPANTVHRPRCRLAGIEKSVVAAFIWTALIMVSAARKHGIKALASHQQSNWVLAHG